MTIPDVNIQIIDIPDTKIHEIVTPNEDGSYTIFINARLSTEDQSKALDHAMNHITNNDFEKDNVQMVEYASHGLSSPISNNTIQENDSKIDSGDKAYKRFEKKYKGMMKRLEKQKKELLIYGSPSPSLESDEDKAERQHFG